MTVTKEPFILYVIILSGLCIGSFLNVCIHRLPREESIAFPKSRCPKCGHPLAWYDNLPVIGFLLLRAKCRHCGMPISLRYPLVEIISAGFCLGIHLRHGLGPPFWILYAFTCALIVITFIDIDHRIIPDEISLPFIGIGLATAWLLPGMRFLDSLYGMLLGGGVLYAIAWGYETLTGREGMGGGDIKLLAMIGAFVGWKGVILTLFVASVMGTIVGGTIALQRRADLKLAIPFGPFLAIGALCHVFYGPFLIDWYIEGRWLGW